MTTESQPSMNSGYPCDRPGTKSGALTSAGMPSAVETYPSALMPIRALMRMSLRSAEELHEHFAQRIWLLKHAVVLT